VTSSPGSVKQIDRHAYSVMELFAAGMRFTDDYTEDDAVEDYLALHPGADEAAVRAELQVEIKKHG
jgi:hypothetical protein